MVISSKKVTCSEGARSALTILDITSVVTKTVRVLVGIKTNIEYVRAGGSRGLCSVFGW